MDLLMPFGRGACGDVYSIWLTNDLEPKDAPIVMFGSEGELSVLARNAKEFCLLLCLGYSELGLEDHSKSGEDFDETQPFRDYMIAIYGFHVPTSGLAIIEESNKQYPEFRNWVEQNVGE